MFKQMKVGTRLILGFLAVCLMGAIVAGIGIRNMSNMNEEAERMYQSELLGLSYIKEANINLIYVGRSMRNALLASSAQDRKKFNEEVQKNLGLLHTNLGQARGLFYTERGKALFAEVDGQLREYQPLVNETLSKANAEELQQQRDSVEFMFSKVSPVANTIDKQMTELAELKALNAKNAAHLNRDLYTSSRNLMIGLVVCSAFIGLAIGMLITRNLTGQLGGEPAYAAQVAERIAAGDLTVAVCLRPGDDKSMLCAMKKMRDSLVAIVTQVRQGTDAMACASSQIASGNLDLSSRTEEQASSLEETASSMEELTATVKQNADNARQANTLASSASEVASQGGMVVSQVVETMGSINESSRKIVDIISVIDGIAFQTNILALNAAVEAARAGEQGRGFAVVASEVRSLAQRSASAAKEIKQLIDDSVEKVEAGAKLVDHAGATMDDIVASVQRVTDIMGEITSASVEQTSGIEQINQAITQMDEVTQQNASLVEEAAAASEALQEQAARLSELVSVFRIDEQAAPRAQPAPAKPATTARRTLPAPARQPARPASRPQPAATAGGDAWEAF